MKAIYLVNPLSGRGHLDAYARLYSRALLDLGYRVILVAKADAGTVDYLRRISVEYKTSFSFVSFDSPPPQSCLAEIYDKTEADAIRARKPAGERARLVWQEGGLA